MRDPEEATDGPTDPQVHPEASPGFGEDPDGLADVVVSRDVVLGEATPRELRASDTAPLAGTDDDRKLRDLLGGDAVERRRAALALADADRSPAVVEALVRAGRTDDDADVRQFAVESLGKLGGETAEAAALAISRDEDPWVRAEAVVALDRIDRAAHADRLAEALADDHHAVRRNAAISLFKLRGQALLPDLLDLVEEDSERVREWAAHLLAGVDDERAEAALRDLAGDDGESDIVRSTAARSLAADPGRFRRQFTGALADGETTLPGEDRLNRNPEL